MYAAYVRSLAHPCPHLQETRIACYCRRVRVLAVVLLTFIFRYFNSTVAAGGQSYFPFKCLSHYLSVTVRPVWPIKVNTVPLAVRAYVCNNWRSADRVRIKHDIYLFKFVVLVQFSFE